MELDDVFNSLAKNAFDFLDRSVNEFEQSPKYSAIHFSAAVEMFLKARLMREHWSLIVAKPEQATLQKFRAGDFVSVTLEDSRNRLRDVAGEEIGDEAFASFRSLSRHRNKMIHFFHPDVDDSGKAKAQIVAEQCRSWYHLHALLDSWQEFEDYTDEVAEANAAMKKHRHYLQAKFDALKKALDEYKAGSRDPRECEACAFEAAIPTFVTDEVAFVRCLVCDHVETQVEMTCPHCEEITNIAREGWGSCTECGGAIEPKDVFRALADEEAIHQGIKDGDDREPANCGSCDGHHSVIRVGEKHFCTSCFDLAEKLEQCGWCAEWNTGDMEVSYSFGCGQCQGQLAHMKDD